MEHEEDNSSRSATFSSGLTYPIPKNVSVLGRSDADVVAAVLGESALGREEFEIVTADEVRGLGKSEDGTFLRRLLVRLKASMGGEYAPEAGGSELMNRYALIQIRVHRNEEQVRTHAILDRHDGDDVHYFGLWTVSPPIEGESDAETLHRRTAH